jgi:hypothetical protein
LLGSEVSLARVRTWNRKEIEFRFNSAKPSISVERLLHFAEQRGLGTEEILVSCHLRFITTSPCLLTLLILLCLYQQIKKFDLPSHNLG